MQKINDHKDYIPGSKLILFKVDLKWKKKNIYLTSKMNCIRIRIRITMY